MGDLSNGEATEWDRGNPARRCVAHKKNGHQCRRWARRGTTVCDYHGAKAPQVKAKARQRLEEAADRMARQLLNMASDEGVSDTVKLAAIRDALDRAGISAKQALELSATQPAKPYEEMLQDLAGIATISRAESRARRGLASDPPALAAPDDELEVVDAELVDPDEPPPSSAPARPPADRDDGPPPPPHTPYDSPSDRPGTGLMTLEEAAEEQARAPRAGGTR